MFGPTSALRHSPDVHEHHRPQAEDWVDRQLQNASLPVAMVTRFGGTNALQYQVVGVVAVPQCHVAQNLKFRSTNWNL